MIRVALYLRQSKEDRQEQSIPVQETQCLLLVEKNPDWKVVVTYQDKHTGLDTDREGYRQLKQDVDKWDIVVARSRRRIHRDVNNWRRFADKMNELGKEAWSVKEGLLTDRNLSSGDWFSRYVTEGLGEMESRITSERIIPAMEHAKERGIHVGCPPIGFKWNREEEKFEPTEWLLAVVGGERFPYPKGKKQGRPLTSSTVKRMLANYRQWKRGELKINKRRTESGTHSVFT